MVVCDSSLKGPGQDIIYLFQIFTQTIWLLLFKDDIYHSPPYYLCASTSLTSANF